MKRFFLYIIIIGVGFAACSKDDSFSTDRGHLLSFSTDTVRLDTLFTTVPSVTHSFWVYNYSGDGLRISTVRLERGNQTGFRVNVDGTYLDPVANNFELRKGDSLRVFVELTAHENFSPDPKLIEDNLLFTLESGVEQRVNVRTHSWDAEQHSGLVITRDTTIETSVPQVFYGEGIRVENNATLTLRNTRLFFHDGAGITVDGGCLVAEGTLFRGDRLDHMFDYLPYDRVSGQWQGISVTSSSDVIVLESCEIRNAMTGLECDDSELQMSNSVVHNSRGHGISLRHSTARLSYCLLSNSLGDCLSADGSTVAVDHCTLAQFYPFSADRGAALRFANTEQDADLQVTNTLLTGYADDVLMGSQTEGEQLFNYHFADCLLRTPAVDDDEHFENIIWEKPDSPIQGKGHFANIDEENLFYDFTIKEESPAYEPGIGNVVKQEQQDSTGQQE